MADNKKCKISKQNFKGWDGIFIENEWISLVAVPVIGGRVMAYDLRPYHFLYVERPLAGKLFTPEEHMGDGAMIHWKNYGGDKTWPAPQGWSSAAEWPGPPDAILDSGTYRVTDERQNEDGSVEIEMTSPPDLQYTGIQISRRFIVQPGSSRVIQKLSFKNISDRSVRWSIWDVNQVATERTNQDGSMTFEPACVITTRLNINSRFPRGFQVMFGNEQNSQWVADKNSGLFVARYNFEIGKVGIDSDCGWIGFSNEAAGYAMAEQFPYFQDEEYPDNGVCLECWATGLGEASGLNFAGKNIYHMEMEVLSPLYTFKPGETHSHEIHWGACRLDGMVTAAQPAGLTSGAVSLEEQENAALRLKGGFGVFDAGKLSLACLDSSGKTLYERELGSVTPLDSVEVDEELPVTAGMSQIALHVTAGWDGSKRLLFRKDL